MFRPRSMTLTRSLPSPDRCPGVCRAASPVQCQGAPGLRQGTNGGIFTRAAWAHPGSIFFGLPVTHRCALSSFTGYRTRNRLIRAVTRMRKLREAKDCAVRARLE